MCNIHYVPLQFKVLSAAVAGVGPVKDEADIPFYLILLRSVT